MTLLRTHGSARWLAAPDRWWRVGQLLVHDGVEGGQHRIVVRPEYLNEDRPAVEHVDPPVHGGLRARGTAQHRQALLRAGVVDLEPTIALHGGDRVHHI